MLYSLRKLGRHWKRIGESVKAPTAPWFARFPPRLAAFLCALASNCAVRQDQNDNIMPTKKQSTGRIDGIVASIIALSRAILGEGDSYYERNRLMVL